MSRIYLPSQGADSWQMLLADPQKHWRTGYSARTLAHCWEAANGVPAEVARLFSSEPELLLAIPEHKVPLPRGRESQSDLFALLKVGQQVCAITIEGKVDESFDRLVSEWLIDASPGKHERLTYLCDMLGLDLSDASDLRYQLLHRTASAVIESRRFQTPLSAMVVHSFSPTKKWFADFAQFAERIGVRVASPDTSGWATLPDGTQLMLGWASGDPVFLTA